MKAKIKGNLKRWILLVLIVDLILLALVFAPFDFEKKEPGAIQATEAMATGAATVPEETEMTQTQPGQTQEAETVPPTTEPAPERFLLTFAGDCTLGSSERAYYAPSGFVKTVGDDLKYPFANVIDYFASDDFTMVNLEGVLAERGTPIPKSYNFRGPVKFVGILTQGSVEAVTLANNHTLDYGPKGYESTVNTLDEAQVPYVEPAGTKIVTTQRGLRVGLYAMTYADLDVEKMEAGIAQLKEQGVDVIVVAAHWGAEGLYVISDEQQTVGRAAIDAGAHIVFGTHPHVLQPIEEYNGGIIYYSLGNFAFGGNGAPKDMDTAIIQQEVLRHADGRVSLGVCTAVPACVSSVPEYNNFQPTPYAPGSQEYDRVMSKLNGTYE